MGCCLVLAFVMAVVLRPLRRGSGDGGFAPIAARGTSAEPLAPRPLVRAGAPPQPAPPAGAGSGGLAASARVGAAAGLLGHAGLISLLLATGAVEAPWLSPWVRAAVLGGAAILLTARASGATVDPAVVAVVGGGTAFLAGLVDMHMLGAFTFAAGPSVLADALLHGWPLLVVAMGAALEFRRPRQPLTTGPR